MPAPREGGGGGEGARRRVQPLGAGGPGLDAEVRVQDWGATEPGAAQTHPPAVTTTTFSVSEPALRPGSGRVLHCVSKTLNAEVCIEGREPQEDFVTN